jgi:alpha-tubulin suppressor-like RCC1 family protein
MFRQTCSRLIDAVVIGEGNDADLRCGRSEFTAACVLSCQKQVASQLVGGAARECGGTHSCILLTDFTIKCWGCNDYGALGNGTNTDSLTAVTGIGL